MPELKPCPNPEPECAIGAIADLAEALGVRDIYKLPGAWECQIDDLWHIAVNGQDRPIDVEPDGAMQATVDPFVTAIWFNGWLAGLVSPVDGVIAGGDAANEDAFCTAVRARIVKEQSP